MKEVVRYNEKKIKEAKELIEEIKKDLYQTDWLLYNAVMKISYAKGMNDVIYDNPCIDMNKPEELMIQCRKSTTFVSDTLKTQIEQLDQYMKEKKEM